MALLLASDVVLVMRFPLCEQGAASQHMGLRKRCCRRAREDVKRRDLPLGNGAVPVVKPPPAKWCCVAATTEHGASVDAPHWHQGVSPSDDDCDREPPRRRAVGARARAARKGSNGNQKLVADAISAAAASPQMPPACRRGHPHRVWRTESADCRRDSRGCAPRRCPRQAAQSHRRVVRGSSGAPPEAIDPSRLDGWCLARSRRVCPSSCRRLAGARARKIRDGCGRGMA